MKIICPNLKNKEVAREFEELKNATSEAAAYHIWSQNNGNGIDKAPNGEPSKLFSDLLEHYNGDRVAAIQAKARTYSKSFKEWFGDWQSEDKNNVSKVVDENGEPLVVYHGSSSEFDTFAIPSVDNRQYLSTKIAPKFFFTPSIKTAKSFISPRDEAILHIVDRELDFIPLDEVQKGEEDEFVWGYIAKKLKGVTVEELKNIWFSHVEAGDVHTYKIQIVINYFTQFS